VDEATAWLSQAHSDRQAAERFAEDTGAWGRCHAIAKYQQTVEKAIKAIVAALHQARILGGGVRTRHDVDRYMGALVRLPRSAENKRLQSLLHGLLDQSTWAGIRALDGLAPQLPPRRNTEYPFQDANGRWTYPAADGVFTSEEVGQFRLLAHRLLEGIGRITSALRRRPR
jgi:hypothetical protein